MLAVNVNGGTGAGRKMHVKQPLKHTWTCHCGHVNPRYASRCLASFCRSRP